MDRNKEEIDTIMEVNIDNIDKQEETEDMEITSEDEKMLLGEPQSKDEKDEIGKIEKEKDDITKEEKKIEEQKMKMKTYLKKQK